MNEYRNEAPSPLLALIRGHWASIQAALDDDQQATLVARLRAVSDARDDTRARRKALQGVRLALLPLPLDHPVRAALDSPRGAAAPVMDDPLIAEQARELLSWLADPPPADPSPPPETAEIRAAVRRRLLAEPSLSDAEVRARCAGHAPAPGLIRLDDPVRGPRYPAFQFTGDGGGNRAVIPPVVRYINHLLMADRDPWGAADWWLSGNVWLGGRPAALIGELPDETLTGAAAAMVGAD
ncbi:hypothetical protein AB0D04_37090 [Streptomyces sp. NPDC048483]|uniref:hypothetical protein n=1 Tax=Streptomyces sp. NPDC048483 TaxID=3154927 RepID=UPI003412B34C